MKIDCKKIASDIGDEIITELAGLKDRPRLGIIYVGENPAIESFIKIKKRFGEKIGIEVLVEKFTADTDIEIIKDRILKMRTEGVRGIVVQLPLPENFYTEDILSLIPFEYDVDVVSTLSLKAFENREYGFGLSLFPPVAGAVREILQRNNIKIAGEKVAIVGAGRLVGRPVATMIEQMGGEIVSCDRSTNLSEILPNTKIIISGAGVPGLIKKDMISEGAILIDAGTSEVSGVLKGDIDEECFEKASFYTTVPGGVGPITVAILFRNLVELQKMYGK